MAAYVINSTLIFIATIRRADQKKAAIKKADTRKIRGQSGGYMIALTITTTLESRPASRASGINDKANKRTITQNQIS